MNGFKILHENKIMHRDVKLANIFLNDDVVVIGDFGFAKLGDIAFTNLGTPVTMAPELLLKSNVRYNSKADLWSIGVCFYHMIFGFLPFEANTYDDLKKKVFKYSGENVPFPKNIKTS